MVEVVEVVVPLVLPGVKVVMVVVVVVLGLAIVYALLGKSRNSGGNGVVLLTVRDVVAEVIEG